MTAATFTPVDASLLRVSHNFDDVVESNPDVGSSKANNDGEATSSMLSDDNSVNYLLVVV